MKNKMMKIEFVDGFILFVAYHSMCMDSGMIGFWTNNEIKTSNVYALNSVKSLQSL